MRHGPAELLVAAGAGATLRGELRVELLEGDPVSSLEPAFAAGFPATAAQFRIAGIALLEIGPLIFGLVHFLVLCLVLWTSTVVRLAVAGGDVGRDRRLAASKSREGGWIGLVWRARRFGHPNRWPALAQRAPSRSNGSWGAPATPQVPAQLWSVQVL